MQQKFRALAADRSAQVGRHEVRVRFERDPRIAVAEDPRDRVEVDARGQEGVAVVCRVSCRRKRRGNALAHRSMPHFGQRRRS